jgi:hypothetical protein
METFILLMMLCMTDGAECSFEQFGNVVEMDIMVESGPRKGHNCYDLDIMDNETIKVREVACKEELAHDEGTQADIQVGSTGYETCNRYIYDEQGELLEITDCLSKDLL